MSLLIESIKLLDGKFYGLRWHERRMMRSLHSIFGITEPVFLERFLGASVFPQVGLYKCRVVYDAGSIQKMFILVAI